MEEYWFLYGEYFQDVIEKNDWYYNTNEQIKEIYDKYNELFPNDDEDNLSKISLYLYLYYDKHFIHNNRLYLEILSLSKLHLSIRAIKYIIQKDQEHFKDVIDAINRKKVTVYESKRTQKIKLWSEKSLESVKRIGENFERNHQFFETNNLFNGQFKIADANRVHTHRRGSIRDRFMGMEKNQMVKAKSRYNAVEVNIERVFEVWLKMIKEFYSPLEVCISTMYIFLFSQTGRTHEISKKKKSDVYSKMKSKREKHSTFDPNLYLIIPEHIIDELEQCKQDKFLVRLFIRYDDRFTGHANALIIDKNNKLIYRMEPGGIDEENDRQIEEQLTKYPYFLWKKYKYMGTVKTCPKKLGTQKIEKDLRNVLKIPKDYSGSTSCFMWSLLFLEYIIHYKDIYQKPSDVYNHIIHRGNLIHLIYGYIADLMLRYEEMELKGYRFQNTDKMYHSPLQLKQEFERSSQLVFDDFLFDVENDDHVLFLYNVIYDGYTTFDEVFARIFSNELSEGSLVEQLNNIENLLQVLQDGTLVDDLLQAHDEMNPGREFPQKHLPSSNIEYYKPIVENFANKIHDNDIAFEIFEIFNYFFQNSTPVNSGLY